jgi:hypothetical protein
MRLEIPFASLTSCISKTLGYFNGSRAFSASAIAWKMSLESIAMSDSARSPGGSAVATIDL